MPRCCVPLCNNNEKSAGIKMHRFPANEKKQKIWINRIRRENFTGTFDSRICSAHFTDDFSKGPTKFPWNVNKDFELNQLSYVSASRKKLKSSSHSSPVKIGKRRATQEMESSDDSSINNNGYDTTNTILQMELDKARLTIKEKEKEVCDLKRRVEYLSKFENEVTLLKIEMEQKSKQVKKLEDSLDLMTAPKDSINLFDNSLVKKWGKETVAAFTGLQDYSSIQILTDMLQQKKLNYHNGSKPKFSIFTQILLTLLKLKLDASNEVLAYLFETSATVASNIFNSMLLAVYELFYEGIGPLAVIPCREQNQKSLPRCFSQIPNCRIVIDCTEFTMQGPSKMSEKKIVYSNYKSRYTMKVLVGCAPNGTVTYVSSLFGGSESDKSIVMRSGLLSQMLPGDLILADKGFQLYDIMPPGVSLNIPSFLVKNQFTVSETALNMINTRARVIIERLNARFKVFKILECIKASERPKAETIVKVCIALTTLMPTLMAELN